MQQGSIDVLMGPENLILTDTQTALCCELQPSVTRTYILSLKGTAAQRGGVREDQSLLIEPAKQPNATKIILRPESASVSEKELALLAQSRVGGREHAETQSAMSNHKSS